MEWHYRHCLKPKSIILTVDKDCDNVNLKLLVYYLPMYIRKGARIPPRRAHADAIPMDVERSRVGVTSAVIT